MSNGGDQSALNPTQEALNAAQEEVLTDWRHRARDAQYAHHLAANRFESMNYVLGVPAVVFSTVVGTAVFATLQKEVDFRIKIIVGLISVTAAVLTALQTFMRFPERAEHHRLAAAHYGAVRSRLQALSAFRPSTVEELLTEIKKIQEIREKLSADSPRVPDDLWRKAKEHEKK
jgi:hypothetical protein